MEEDKELIRAKIGQRIDQGTKEYKFTVNYGHTSSHG